jgi:alkylation response protein AidB-like acyl-CoA dehydrogenase
MSQDRQSAGTTGARGPDLAELLEHLRGTAAERDRRGGHAAPEKQMLADAGLLTLTIPVAYGGQGASWPETYALLRRLANVDSALAHLLGFQYLQVTSVLVWGNPAQRERYLRGTVAHRWWWGNAVNPVDTRLIALEHADGVVLDGMKGFCSGTQGSQRMVISAHWPNEGAAEKSGKTVVAVIPTDRDGVTVHDDWDPIGQRQTDSGSVSFQQVHVPRDDILHSSTAPASPYASLRTLVAQLLLANLFVGIAEGAFAEARAYVMQFTRPWFASGVTRSADDPYVIQRFAEMRLKIAPAQALTDRAAVLLEAAWQQGEQLAAVERAQVALAIAEAKVLAHRAALDVTEAIFDVCGARATHAALGLDRFWRNARTHTLHDPIDYKIKAIGRYALEGILPEPNLYT